MKNSVIKQKKNIIFSCTLILCIIAGSILISFLYVLYSNVNLDKLKEKGSYEKISESMTKKYENLQVTLKNVKDIESKGYVKDQNSEDTMLNHIKMLSDKVGNENIISVEPKFNAETSDNDFSYIPVNISFAVGTNNIIDVFKSFDNTYPEPKFENLSLEYKDNKLIASVEMISITVRQENIVNDSIQKVYGKLKDVLNPHTNFGTLTNDNTDTNKSNSSGNVVIGGINNSTTPSNDNNKNNDNGSTSGNQSNIEYSFKNNPPLKIPIQITSHFGNRKNPVTGQPEVHSGVDIRAPIGTPVYSVSDGVVESITDTGPDGKRIIIKSTFNGRVYEFYYCQLSEFKVSVNQHIRKGDVIGTTGNTGVTTGPHLHFGVKIDGKFVDPEGL